MTRVLIIPAAGLGSRLESAVPKVLFPVNGIPMIDHTVALFAPVVDRFILVLNPAFDEQVRRHCQARGHTADFVVQHAPTGMLDAILLPAARVRELDATEVWITWCDQVAIHPRTVERLDRLAAQADARCMMIFPTVERPDPYIHLVRGAHGEIVKVLHAREGDAMPDVGEGDMGLFRLSRVAYVEMLPEFARMPQGGSRTRERNFLPFIPWLAARGTVRTYPAVDAMESIGVNTREDLAAVERYLREREAALGAG
ncbi:MAG TPA: NTP transferase domain-containing protein [Gemmatimonadaceae bacterium]|nr:NTP transferase domain-containing protein [Gemmatimonadaceae bacterium]